MSELSRVQQVGPTNPGGRSDSLAFPLSSGQRAGPPRELPVGVARIADGLPEVGRRILQKERGLEEAVRIRDAHRINGQKREFLAQMKAALYEVRKSYPPFPPGSEERVRRLRQYAALRALIDRLTIPPEEETRTKTSSRPAEGMHAVVVDDRSGIRAVRREEQAVRAAGVPIPELAEGAAEGDIDRAAGGLEAAGEMLDAERATLLEAGRVFPENDGTAPMTEAEAAALASTTEAELHTMSLPVMTDSRTWMFHFLA